MPSTHSSSHPMYRVPTATGTPGHAHYSTNAARSMALARRASCGHAGHVATCGTCQRVLRAYAAHAACTPGCQHA